MQRYDGHRPASDSDRTPIGHSELSVAQPVVEALSKHFAEKDARIEERLLSAINATLEIGRSRLHNPSWKHCSNIFCYPILACAAIPPKPGEIADFNLHKIGFKITFRDKSNQRISYSPLIKELFNEINAHLEDGLAFQLAKSSHIARALNHRELLSISDSENAVIEGSLRRAVDPSKMLAFHSPDIAYILFDKTSLIAFGTDGKMWREEYTPQFQKDLSSVLKVDPPPEINQLFRNFTGYTNALEFKDYVRKILAYSTELYSQDPIINKIPEINFSATSLIAETFKLKPLVHPEFGTGQFTDFSMDELSGVMFALGMGSHTVVRSATRFGKRTDFEHLTERDEFSRKKRQVDPFVENILRDRLIRLLNLHDSSRWGLPGHHPQTLVFDVPLLEGLKANHEKYGQVALATFASNVLHHASSKLVEDFYLSIPGTSLHEISNIDHRDYTKLLAKLRVAFIKATMDYELSFIENRPPRLGRDTTEALEKIYGVPPEESILLKYPSSCLLSSQLELPKLEGPSNGG